MVTDLYCIVCTVKYISCINSASPSKIMEELPEWKQYQIEIHTLGLYVSGNSYIVETVYSVTISVQTEQRLT